MNPQVHMADDRSVIEAIDAQGDTVRTARSFMTGRPIIVSTVTLKPPFNQAAIEEEVQPAPGELPPEVDVRQPSLFAAAWTVGSIRSLASAGAASITYYETVGWRGLLESEGGPALPERFHSLPGMVFPVYHVFRWLADAGGAETLESSSSHPLRPRRSRPPGRRACARAGREPHATAPAGARRPPPIGLRCGSAALTLPRPGPRCSTRRPLTSRAGIVPVEAPDLEIELGSYEAVRIDED